MLHSSGSSAKASGFSSSRNCAPIFVSFCNGYSRKVYTKYLYYSFCGFCILTEKSHGREKLLLQTGDIMLEATTLTLPAPEPLPSPDPEPKPKPEPAPDP